MNFSQSPVKTAGKWLKEIDADMLMVFAIDENGALVSVSYGKTKPLCKRAGEMLDDLHDYIIKGADV
jgi:hypothetical protein